jgi:hypothetical protein
MTQFRSDDYDWFAALDSQGIKAIEILAGFMGFEQAWFEHIVMDRMEHAANPCKCRTLGGERQEECPKWLASKQFLDAEEALERAKKNLESARKNLNAHE